MCFSEEHIKEKKKDKTKQQQQKNPKPHSNTKLCMKALTSTDLTWFALKTEAPIHTAVVGESRIFQVNRN